MGGFSMQESGNSGTKQANAGRSMWLFNACFIALVATSFGFILRTQIIGDWGAEFNLTETQKGELLGVGLWPFALSIILFSLAVDRIGYGTAMIFAFVCHVASAIITIFATGYTMLYVGTFIVALGNGTVEAVINPVVATVYSKEKTKWLNILHAGWPGGLVLGGILALAMGPSVSWEWKVALILIPTVIYGFMLFRCKWPVQERVQAGVSYKEMLQEAGIIGAGIVIIIMMGEIGRLAEFSFWTWIIISVVIIVLYGIYVRSIGQPMFILLLLIMIPLATTELGTDSWVTELVIPVMSEIGIQPGWILVYTSLIMMILRFYAGPIVHRLQPLGLLATCSAIACLGLIFLSKATGLMIFLAATLYGVGKTFFWPTMLGVVAERFPKGGALTLNSIAGMGMLSVGVIGAVLLGNIQDNKVESDLMDENQAIHEQVVGEEMLSIFGKYRPIVPDKVAALSEADQNVVSDVRASAKQSALMTVAIFPFIMLICYLILIFYFRSKGGYKPVELNVKNE
jgi:MFS family permease